MLFSGAALALAIYSMVLQQQQAREFEERTVHAEQRTAELLKQQARAIGLIEQSLAQQISAGRVSALTFLIERREQRIEQMRDWGRNKYNDENHYRGGVEAAQRRIAGYEKQITELGQVALGPAEQL